MTGVPTKVRVVLRAANQLLAEALGATLESNPDITVVPTASEASAAVVVLDQEEEEFRALGRQAAELPTVVVVNKPASAVVLRVICTNVRHVVVGWDGKELSRAVQAVSIGEDYLSRAAYSFLLDHLSGRSNMAEAAAAAFGLTPHERRVLTLVVQGKGNTQIAAKLRLSPNTVKGYVSDVYRKLGVKTRSEAIALANRLNLA